MSDYIKQRIPVSGGVYISTKYSFDVELFNCTQFQLKYSSDLDNYHAEHIIRELKKSE